MLRRLLHWAYFRATGEIWSPSMGAMGLAPTPLWVWTGRDVDALRIGPNIWESFAAGMREADEEPPSDPLEPYRVKGSPEQRAACLHPPDDRQPLSGDGWLCDLCGADCAPPEAFAGELTAVRLQEVEQLARQAHGDVQLSDLGRKSLAAATLALTDEVKRFRGIGGATAEDPHVGVDLGEPATFAAVTVERRPDGTLRPLATFEGADAEQRARELIADLPEEPAAPKAGPRIELRDGAEVTVGSSSWSNGCHEHGPVTGYYCTVHIDGWHVTEVGEPVAEGSWRVMERWG